MRRIKEILTTVLICLGVAIGCVVAAAFAAPLFLMAIAAAIGIYAVEGLTKSARHIAWPLAFVAAMAIATLAHTGCEVGGDPVASPSGTGAVGTGTGPQTGTESTPDSVSEDVTKVTPSVPESESSEQTPESTLSESESESIEETPSESESDSSESTAETEDVPTTPTACTHERMALMQGCLTMAGYENHPGICSHCKDPCTMVDCFERCQEGHTRAVDKCLDEYPLCAEIYRDSFMYCFGDCGRANLECTTSAQCLDPGSPDTAHCSSAYQRCQSDCSK